jgi:hypothetical protein
MTTSISCHARDERLSIAVDPYASFCAVRVAVGGQFEATLYRSASECDRLKRAVEAFNRVMAEEAEVGEAA